MFRWLFAFHPGETAKGGLQASAKRLQDMRRMHVDRN